MITLCYSCIYKNRINKNYLVTNLAKFTQLNAINDTGINVTSIFHQNYKTQNKHLT